MHPLRIAAPLLAAATFAGSALAAEPSGRFRMSPVDGGFVRLDTETGAMALCTGKDQAWTCAAMADDQANLQRRIETLEAENKELREENRRLEEVLGLGEPKPGDPGKPPAPPPSAGVFQLPSEQDIDKGFDYIEKMLKKFRDRMKKLEETERPDGRAL